VDYIIITLRGSSGAANHHRHRRQPVSGTVVVVVVDVAVTTTARPSRRALSRPSSVRVRVCVCVGGSGEPVATQHTRTHKSEHEADKLPPRYLYKDAAAAAADDRVRVRVCIEQRDQSTRVTGIPPGHRDAAALRTGRRSPLPPPPLLVYNKLRSGHLRFQYTVILLLYCYATVWVHLLRRCQRIHS